MISLYHPLACASALVPLLAAAGAALAQAPSIPPDTLPLRDLGAFRSAAAGWRVVGTVGAERTRALAMPAVDGAGVLLNAGGGARGDLVTRWEHGDLDLELEFMTA